MNPICKQEFSNFLEKSEISMAPEERNTGCELISTCHNQRIVVVHIPSDGTDEYIKNILGILFASPPFYLPAGMAFLNFVF